MKKYMSTYVHSIHLVTNSPWPIFMSFALLFLLLILCSWLNHINFPFFYVILVSILIFLIVFQWFRDIIREGQEGSHTKLTQKGLMISFLIFLITEVMLFFSLFWAFFHSSLSPAIELGAMWPPLGVNPINTWALPLFGTGLLLSSGFILTYGHHALIKGDKYSAFLGIIFASFLGFLFCYGQYIEYCYSEFTIADSVFGSVFFMTTGLHFSHVIAGALFLFVSSVRLFYDNFSSEHNLGLDCAIIYYHLVDILWIFVYIIFYYFGGL